MKGLICKKNRRCRSGCLCHRMETWPTLSPHERRLEHFLLLAMMHYRNHALQILVFRVSRSLCKPCSLLANGLGWKDSKKKKKKKKESFSISITINLALRFPMTSPAKREGKKRDSDTLLLQTQNALLHVRWPSPNRRTHQQHQQCSQHCRFAGLTKCQSPYSSGSLVLESRVVLFLPFQQKGLALTPLIACCELESVLTRSIVDNPKHNSLIETFDCRVVLAKCQRKNFRPKVQESPGCSEAFQISFHLFREAKHKKIRQEMETNR